jgi:hypothetical protein
MIARRAQAAHIFRRCDERFRESSRPGRSTRIPASSDCDRAGCDRACGSYCYCCGSVRFSSDPVSRFMRLGRLTLAHSQPPASDRKRNTKLSSRNRFGCVDCVMPGSNSGYAHKACRNVFTNLETNSALTRISFPLASRCNSVRARQSVKRQTLDFACWRSSEPASQTALRSRCALPPLGRNARPGSNLD